MVTLAPRHAVRLCLLFDGSTCCAEFCSWKSNCSSSGCRAGSTLLLTRSIRTTPPLQLRAILLTRRNKLAVLA
jgi:hypothetical protein